MAEIVITLTVPVPRETVWRRLWSPRRHTAAIPLTRVTTTPAGSAMDVEGVEICARTALGPVGFDDTMRVVAVATPPTGPWTCRLVKTGRLVTGSILCTVGQVGAGTQVRWRQRIRIGGQPTALDPVVAAVAWVAYGAGLRRIAGSSPRSVSAVR